MIKQTHLITPWSICCVQEYLYRNVCTVVFGCKNCKLIAFSPENSGWAEQLSTIITTFITYDRARANIPQKTSHSSIFWDRYLQGRLRTCLKHVGLTDFPITNIGILWPRALDASNPVHCTLLCFPPEQRLLRKCKDFHGSASSDQIHLH